MDISAARAIINSHSHSVAKSDCCAIRRDRGKVNCRQYSCLKKTVVYAVNSSHLIFHNSALESVITFGKKTYRRVSINEETTTQEKKAQNLRTLSGVIDPVRVLSIRSGFCQRPKN